MREKIECDDEYCIRQKGSSALIYAFGYHNIFGEVLRSDHYTMYAQAPVMSLLAFNIEITLKGIIMTQIGIEPWKGSGRNEHSLTFLIQCLPKKYDKQLSDFLIGQGYDNEYIDNAINSLDKAFIEFRYNYEYEEQEISEKEETFLKLLWQVVYDLGQNAQLEYMNKYV